MTTVAVAADRLQKCMHLIQSLRLFLLTLDCLLYSQHVSSSPAVAHVSLLRSALTAAGAVGYKGKALGENVLRKFDLHLNSEDLH